MKLCILENDVFDPGMAPHMQRLADAFERMFVQAGAQWQIDAFNATLGEYPASFAGYDAVLLTGSRADAFSDVAWVVELRRRVTELLAQRKKIIGVCFGHQLLGVCLGAKVGRAAQGWGAGRMAYQWADGSELAVLASHQDQVLELPSGATLMASSDFCPVAGFTVGEHVYSVQPHPEMDAIILGNLLKKRRAIFGEEKYTSSMQSLEQGHDGLEVARKMIAFVEA